MSRASLVLAGLVSSLCAAACDGDVTVGGSQIEVSASADDGGADADSSSGTDAAGDELARIAEELAGTWSGSFVDFDLTLHLTYTADRGGTVRLECMRSGQECGDPDGGVSGFDFFRGGGKYWVAESTGAKVTGALVFNPISAGAAVFTFDPAKNTLTMGPPLLLVTTFTRN